MITIHNETTKQPSELMGRLAGECWGSDTTKESANIKRGRQCIADGHGRVAEIPRVYMTIEGYSARFMRELYTHIGSLPTRLQASTRYIDYKDFKYYTPENLNELQEAQYRSTMLNIAQGYETLLAMGVKKEDAANVLPLGMMSKMVFCTNLRHLIEMSHQRKCMRALPEFRKFMAELEDALCKYSTDWSYYVDNYFEPKCEYLGYCPEKFSCGRVPARNK